MPRQRVTHHALPVQSSAPLEHDDKTAPDEYIRAMPAQEPALHEFPRLLDDAAQRLASNQPKEKLRNRHAVKLTDEEEAFLTSITTSGQYSLAKVAAMYAVSTSLRNEEDEQVSQSKNPPPLPAT